MINLLILEGLPPLRGVGSPLYADIGEVFSVSLFSALRGNGISARTVRPDGIENGYYIIGRNNNNIIYAPCFSNGAVSFLHTDSTCDGSIAYGIAREIRKKRDGITFIGTLADGDCLYGFSPIIVDEIAAGTDDKVCPYSLALSTAGVISDFLKNLPNSPNYRSYNAENHFYK